MKCKPTQVPWSVTKIRHGWRTQREPKCQGTAGWIERTSRLVLGMSLAALWSMTAPASATAIGYDFDSMMWSSGFSLGHMFLGGAMMLAFWGVLVLLVLGIYRLSSLEPRQGPGAAARGFQFANLEEQYVRDDIDRDEPGK